MTIRYGAMRPGQEAEVAALIKTLVDSYGVSFESRVSEDSLRAASDFLRVDVAERDGKVVGASCWVMTFSTWRGVKGMYLADLVLARDAWTMPAARNLLRASARAAAREGAAFIRLEADISDEQSEVLYAETGFTRQQRHDLYYLEQNAFAAFVAETMPVTA